MVSSADSRTIEASPVVYSGRRSLQVHFVFSTQHLDHAPWNVSAGERLGRMKAEAALMANVHNHYWDHVRDAFVRILQPSIQPDRKMRSLTQWRRAPWAIRTLDKDAPALGLRVGMQVPQIVICENIRTRAPRESESFLVSPTFTIASPVRSGRQSARGSVTRKKSVGPVYFDQSAGSEMIMEARELCRAEWGEFPKLADMTDQTGEWLLRFWNHADDQNPSTIVQGDYRQLLLNGRHPFGYDKFRLPEGLTANEFGDHFAVCFGLKSPSVVKTEVSAHPPENEPAGLQSYGEMKDCVGAAY